MLVGFSCFGLAIRFGFNDKIAPRTWARPANVIRNVFSDEKSSKHQWTCFAFRWIPWSLGLSYQDMMNGIKGTGTRSNGYSGKRLKCNLDGIVLVRYHALCLRVATLATVLCLCLVMPLNITATCDKNDVHMNHCNSTMHLTNFERTTLAHIPSVGTNGHEYVLFFRLELASILGRLYGIVLVAWVLYVYTCRKSSA